MGIDSIFGIGAWEFLVILIIAGVVMGPERLGQFARWLGKVTSQLQMISRGFARQLKHELDAIDDTGEISGTIEDMRELRKQVDELRAELRRTADTAVNEVRQVQKESSEILADSKQMVQESMKLEENRIAPPTLPPAPAENGGKMSRTTPEEGKMSEAAPEEKPAPPSSPAIPVPPPNLPKLVDVPDDPEE